MSAQVLITSPDGKWVTAGCPKCQGRFSMKLVGRYYEGTCTCGERWQMPKEEQTRTQETAARQNLMDELETLYQTFFVQGKRPGLMDAQYAWTNIMTKYEKFRPHVIRPK